MFHIFANGEEIYRPGTPSFGLISPKLTLEMGKAGSLQFGIPVVHEYYSRLSELSTRVSVELDNAEVFRGRVLSISRAYNNTRTVYCEGDLSYLVDSVQPTQKYVGKAHDLFRQIIAVHNARVDVSKQFAVGEITVPNRDVILTGISDEIEDAETGKFNYEQIAINATTGEWQTSLDFITTCLIDYTGGYLRTRRSGSTIYVDLLAEYGSDAVQAIEFGRNLLDLTQEVSTDNAFSVLVPLGDKNLTIESVNDGSDELVSEEALEKYGRIVKSHVFDSVTSPKTLLENAQRYLKSNAIQPPTITARAVDMHLMDSSIGPINVGDKVHIVSAPHGMRDVMTCTRIEYDLANPANDTYTFGDTRQSLTERYRKDRSKSQASGSRGGGGGSKGSGAASSEAVEDTLKRTHDAWVDYDKDGGTVTIGAFYKKWSEDREVFKQNLGIDLDAPGGKLNIYNMRYELDEVSGKVTEQNAQITLMNNELGARIDLTASHVDKLEGIENTHYASITVRANELESAIEMKAEKVVVDSLNTTINATSSDLQSTKDILKKTCGIELDSTGSSANVNIRTLAEKVSAQGETVAQNTAAINAFSSEYVSVTSMDAVYKDIDTNKTNIASISASADKNGTQIRLNADNISINSKNITDINSEITNVKKLIADEVEARKAATTWINASYVNVSGAISASAIAIGTDAVATQAWVKDQGYTASSSIPDDISCTWVRAKYINVSGSLSASAIAIGTDSVATQAWVRSQGYSTGSSSSGISYSEMTSYVNSQLSDYVTGSAFNNALSNYATRDWVRQNYSSSSGSGGVTESRVNTLIQNALADYATVAWVLAQGYSTGSGSSSVSWSDITGKPSKFPPSLHRHSFSTTILLGHSHTYKRTSGGSEIHTSTELGSKTVSGTTDYN
nr:MAG TPA: endopeptidase tail [Caudoviricetes sp.]